MLYDILGNPWNPCPQCPRRIENGGDGTEWGCLSRAHLILCDHTAKNWIAWRDVVRKQPEETREFAPKPNSKVKKRERPWPSQPTGNLKTFCYKSMIGCPFRNRAGCSCSAKAFCMAQGAKLVRDTDCLDCVRRMVTRALPAP